MTRNLKTLGLTLVAVLALGVLIASSASAAGERFHSEVEPTIGTGTTEEGTKDKFTAGSFTIECHGKFAGTGTAKTETTLTVAPVYSNCTSSAGTPTVSTTGCAYVVTSETNATGHLPFSIECTSGSAITISVSGCTLRFGVQTVTGGVKATNIGAGSTREITADVTASGITFTKEGGIACLFISGDTGTYTATVKVAGFEDMGVSGNIDNSPTHAVYTEGDQKGVWWE